MRKQEDYWSFRAPDTPELSDLPKGAFAGTAAGWNSLSPGYRRDIYRSAAKKAAAVEVAVEADLKRLARADLKHESGMKSILARETL